MNADDNWLSLIKRRGIHIFPLAQSCGRCGRKNVKAALQDAYLSLCVQCVVALVDPVVSAECSYCKNPVCFEDKTIDALSISDAIVAPELSI